MRRFCLVLVFALALAGRAGAQSFETAGARALGMGGAFVGVADDVTAIWWNPAGLATGGFFGLAVERHDFEPEQSSWFLGAGSLPLGLSYVRTRDHQLTTHQAGVTLLQSVSDTIVVSGTAKFVRGNSMNAFDADVAVMAHTGELKVGLTVRNITSPEFETADGAAIELPWRARAGVSYLATRSVIVALDVDLRPVQEGPDKRRNLALGGEYRLARLSLRSGARFDTIGDVNPLGTVGGSYAVRNGMWVDVWAAAGDRDAGRGWGLAGRIVY